MGIKKMADVVSMLPWVGKKQTPSSEPADETVRAVSAVADTAEVSAPKLGVQRISEISFQEFEAMQCRIEVAKTTAAVREEYAGINRNRIRRLLRIITLAILGAFLVQFSPLGTPKVKLPIDKVTLGAAIPVAAFAGGKERVGHIAVLKVSGGIDGSLHGEPDVGNTPLYLATALAAAEADPDLAAVIIEIDSPGGSSILKVITIETSLPSICLSRNSFALTAKGCNRWTKFTASFTPHFLQVSTISCACLVERAIGFSQRIFFPASAALITCS
jgi:hypothetical protein